MASFSADEINAAMSSADAASRQHGDDLAQKWPWWKREFDFLLSESQCRYVSYFPMVCLTLVARSISGGVDVRKIKVGADADGYSAQAIGRVLTPFATAQGIHMRTTTSQVVNSQPFTHAPRLTADLRDRPEYQRFFAAVEAVQSLSQADAGEVLALAFHQGRAARVAKQVLPEPALIGSSLAALRLVTGVVSQFASEVIEGGKVGQALGAALLDVAYGSDAVTMAKINDPGFTTPGDFHAGTQPVWLAGEAKQTPVTSGAVEAFLSGCVKVGIERAVYLALDNAKYPQNLNEAAIHNRYDDQIQFQIFTSSSAAVTGLLSLAPGTPAQQALRLAERFLLRMQEIGCSDATQTAYVAALHGAGYL